MKLGNIDIVDLRLGASQVSAWLGGEMVWGGEEPVAVTPLTFTALESNSSIRLNKVGYAPTVSLEYSTDGSNWSDYTWSGSTGTQVSLANEGDSAYFRAKNDNAKLANAQASDYCNFVATGKLSAYGNMMTLLKGDGTLQDLTDSNACAFACLFDSCTALVGASQLELPSKYVPVNGYANMFYGCSNLSTGPNLPALSANQCAYWYMFSGAGLVEAPQIAATKLLSANECGYMFSGCSSLTSAPAILPATAITVSCYQYMFSGCSSLTTAPALPATTLANYCYSHMFQNCTSLSNVNVSFTWWHYFDMYTALWLDNVAATGVFMCPKALPDTRGPSKIPADWTKLAPPLCFTLEDTDSPTDIYIRKDGSPTVVSLEFSDNGIDWYDYDMTGSRGMSIQLDDQNNKIYFRAKNENSTFSADSSNYYRFATMGDGRIAASGNIQTLLKADGTRTDAPSYCFYRLFYHCGWLTHAPDMPATELNSYCYKEMFHSCTSLTDASKLPAAALKTQCYNSMFSYCTSLSSVNVGLSSWSGGVSSTTYWLSNVQQTGTFTCLSSLPEKRGASTIPTNWTRVDA